MLKFISKEIIEKKFTNQENYKCWLASKFKEIFEAEHISEEIKEEKIFSIIKTFLESRDIKDLIFFPDSMGWRSYSRELKLAPVTFETVEEAISFLKREMFYKLSNYYIANKEAEWVITLCHEADLHVNGKKEFVDSFVKKYLS